MIISTGENIEAIDQMDHALDELRTVWAALHARDLLTDELMEAATNTLNDAILKLEPVREAVNKAHGDYGRGA